MESFLAVITPVGASGGAPTHPIAPGGPPLYPTHPIAPGGAPGVPTQPIYYPPGIWGGGNVPMPSPPIYIPIVPPEGEIPGLAPEHPIYIPIYPAHPIAPGGGGGLGIWGPTDPRPSQPIHIPTWDEIKGNIFGNLPPFTGSVTPTSK